MQNVEEYRLLDIVYDTTDTNNVYSQNDDHTNVYKQNIIQMNCISSLKFTYLQYCANTLIYP